MISNLQFYGFSVALGLVISLAFWRDAKIEKWKVLTVVMVPACWALMGLFFILTMGDGRVDSRNLIRYFDARNFWPQVDGGKNVRILGTLALISVMYFSVAFNLLWGIKNRAYQGAGRNEGKPHTTV